MVAHIAVRQGQPADVDKPGEVGNAEDVNGTRCQQGRVRGTDAHVLPTRMNKKCGLIDTLI